jgi:hypothetical protein
MAIRRQTHFQDGVAFRLEVSDTALGTHVVTENGVVVSTRALTPLEIEAINAQENERTIEQKLDAALLSLRVIVDTPNNQLNAAGAVKDVAREVLLLIRTHTRDFSSDS